MNENKQPSVAPMPEEAPVPESSRPSLDEIAVVLAHLSDRVSLERGATLDPFVRLSIARAVTELRRHIPGLYVPPDVEAAAALATAAADSLRRGRHRSALSRALRGLSFSPHHPELHYLAGTACLHLGAVEASLRLLQHALWIHPGYEPARQDLESLAAFHSDARPTGEPDIGQPSRFELLDDERQGRLWSDQDDLEGWEGVEDEFPDDDLEDRAA